MLDNWRLALFFLNILLIRPLQINLVAGAFWLSNYLLVNVKIVDNVSDVGYFVFGWIRLNLQNFIYFIVGWRIKRGHALRLGYNIFFIFNLPRPIPHLLLLHLDFLIFVLKPSVHHWLFLLLVLNLVLFVSPLNFRAQLSVPSLILIFSILSFDLECTHWHCVAHIEVVVSNELWNYFPDIMNFWHFDKQWDIFH